jgi:soluble lytic murein transglycosylase-like protein
LRSSYLGAFVLPLLTIGAAWGQTGDERLPTLRSTATAPAIEYVRSAPEIAAPLPRPAKRTKASTSSPSREKPAPAVVSEQPEEAEAPAARVAYASPDDPQAPFSWLPPRDPAPAPVTQIPRTVSDNTALPYFSRRVRPGAEPIAPADLAVLIENKAVQHGVPLELANAVVRVESNYDPRLTGRGATIGLMQIKHATARGMGFKGSARDLLEPATNLEWGMRYLAGARKLAKGDLCGTVLRYQYGHMAVRSTHASSVYCGKVRALLGTGQGSRVAEAGRSR